jgi:hypothetical protein
MKDSTPGVEEGEKTIKKATKKTIKRFGRCSKNAGRRSCRIEG